MKMIVSAFLSLFLLFFTVSCGKETLQTSTEAVNNQAVAGNAADTTKKNARVTPEEVLNQDIGHCIYQGTVYYINDTFPAGDGCNTCTCTEDTSVACTEIQCEAPPAPAPGQPSNPKQQN